MQVFEELQQRVIGIEKAAPRYENTFVGRVHGVVFQSSQMLKKGFCYLSFGLSPFPGTLGFQTPCEEVFEPQKTYRKKPTVALVHFLTIGDARNFRRIFKKDGLEKVIYKRFFKHDCFGDFYVRLQRCSVDCLDVSWVVPLPSISGKLSFSSGSPNLKL